MLYFELLDRIETLNPSEAHALDDYLAGRPSDAESEAARAFLHLRLGAPERARVHEEHAARAASVSPIARYTLALCATQRHELERGLELLRGLPEDFPLYAESRALRAAILLTLERPGEAEPLTHDDPTESDALRGALAGIAAQSALAAGDGLTARDAIERALRFTPDVGWMRQARRGFGPPAGGIPTVKP